MDWFCMTNADGEKIIINANAIMDVKYLKDTNLTVIDYIRSAYPSTYVRGNVMTEIKKVLSSHNNNYVTQIGD